MKLYIEIQKQNAIKLNLLLTKQQQQNLIISVTLFLNIMTKNSMSNTLNDIQSRVRLKFKISLEMFLTEINVCIKLHR